MSKLTFVIEFEGGKEPLYMLTWRRLVARLLQWHSVMH